LIYPRVNHILKLYFASKITEMVWIFNDFDNVGSLSLKVWPPPVEFLFCFDKQSHFWRDNSNFIKAGRAQGHSHFRVAFTLKATFRVHTLMNIKQNFFSAAAAAAS
jgi:hypothetical protein